MARREDVTADKFGTPLYGAAFLSETLIAVGGGGGHGLKNKLVVVKFEGGVLESAPVFQLETGDDIAQKLVVHPGGSTLIAAFTDRLQLYSVHLPAAAQGKITEAAEADQKDEKEKKDAKPEPVLTATQPKSNASVLAEAKETKCMAFSKDGSRLAVGGGEGSLLLLSWPELEKVADVKKAHKDSVTDADFSEDGKTLITTGNESAGPEGGAIVWDTKTGAKLCVLSGFGAPPKALVKVRGVKFAVGVREELQNTAYVGANIGGVGKIFVFRKKAEAWACIGSRKALAQPITALAMAPTGKVLAMGTSEGGVATLAASSLSMLNRLPYAHMVFVTALAFSPGGSVIASVSADASARCTKVSLVKKKTFKQAIFRFFLMLLLNYLFWVVVLRLRPDVAEALRAAQAKGWMGLPAAWKASPLKK